MRARRQCPCERRCYRLGPPWADADGAGGLDPAFGAGSRCSALSRRLSAPVARGPSLGQHTQASTSCRPPGSPWSARARSPRPLEGVQRGPVGGEVRRHEDVSGDLVAVLVEDQGEGSRSARIPSRRGQAAARWRVASYRRSSASRARLGAGPACQTKKTFHEISGLACGAGLLGWDSAPARASPSIGPQRHAAHHARRFHGGILRPAPLSASAACASRAAARA